MKIAVASEDGKTVSQHFGRATQYVVVKAEGDKVLSREVRRKAGHSDFAGAEHHEHGCGPHGDDAGSRDRHRAMAQSILDCSTVLAGGMGYGAYQGLKERGIEPVITDVADIEEAIKLYLEGKLPNLMQRLH